MSDLLPDELRDRAAGAACDVYTEIRLGRLSEFDRAPWEWRAVVDAVAEVLAGHVGCEHLDGPYRRLVVERDDLRARVERAEADLAQARAVVADLVEMQFPTDGVIHRSSFEHVRREATWEMARAFLARSVSPDRQETELREEDLRFEYFDVPDQSVIDESGRGVRLTHTPSGVAVSSGAERTQLQNMAQCIELLRRELAARSVSPDPTAALSGPAGAAHTEEET